MKRFVTRTTVALALGLGLTLALLWAMEGLLTVEAAPTAATRYVAPWGDDTGNLCTSPITPCRTVQQAVNLSWSGDDEVLVAGGVYTATSGQVLFIQATVVIRGGYSTDFSAWDPQAYPTTLDGRGLMRVVYMQGDVTPTLESLRLTHGYVSGDGGGIYSVNAHPVISGCRIFSNTTNGGDGGGVYLSSADNASLIGNEIFSNTAGGGATSGGGLYLYQSDGVALLGNVVRNNAAGYYGGGMAMPQDDVTLIDNMVLENRLLIGNGFGSGIGTGASSVRLLHTTIARNSGGEGQGVYVAGSGATIWLTNTILVSNTVGIETRFGANAYLAATLWGDGAWANVTDTVGSNISTGTLAANWWEEPGFIDPDGGDYHIGTGSGAIDRGLDAGVTTDIDGDLRPFCGGPDLGADETTCCANLNGMLYPTVQVAVDASTDPGDVVKVAGICSGVADRDGNRQTVYISKTVTVRGGYTIDDWSASNPDANPTTLDAAKRGRVVYIQGSNDISPTLESLRVINSSTGETGGGIYVEHASPTISGCQIYSNTAWSGGGVTLYEAGGAVLSNNDVHDNAARWGGGVKLDASPFALLGDNTVHHNEATVSGGGGIYMSEEHTATLSGNDIYGNSADEGGGVLLADTIDATLIGNTIHDNSADDGGGLYLNMGQNITLDNNIIVENQSSGNGGGVYVLGGTAHLRHTTLAGNSGQQGVYVYETAIARLTNTILVSHTVGVEADFGATAYLTATLWGDGAWANGTDTDAVGGSIYTDTLNWWGDPAFVDPAGGDYHLGAGSAAFERGVSTGVPYDIDGDLRSVGLGMQPDLGADEALPTLTVTKAGPSWCFPESAITYTLRIVNSGVVTAHAITLSDTLPSGTTFIRASDSGDVKPGSDAVTWLIYTLGPEGDVITRTFVVTATGDVVNDDYLVRSYGTPDVPGTVPVTTQINHAPMAEAGPSQSASPGSLVTLDGSGSSDPDGDPLTYGWAQTGGTPVALSSSMAVSPTFIAPSAPGETLTFTLTVTDTFGVAHSDVTTVAIKHYVYLPLVLRDD
jgi:uncharacterized repeat protein (TIGR01451 family)